LHRSAPKALQALTPLVVFRLLNINVVCACPQGIIIIATSHQPAKQGAQPVVVPAINTQTSL